MAAAVRKPDIHNAALFFCADHNTSAFHVVFMKDNDASHS